MDTSTETQAGGIVGKTDILLSLPEFLRERKTDESRTDFKEEEDRTILFEPLEKITVSLHC